MNKAITIGALIAIGVGTAFWVSQKNTEPEETATPITQGEYDKAPEFVLNDYVGQTVRLSDSTGKIRIVNAWATWCPFCVNELPDFARVQGEYPDDVVVIAINRQESLEQARSFSNDRLGLGNDMTFLLDPTDAFYKSIGGFAMPETLFIDGEGNIRLHKRGPMKYEEI